MTQSDIDEMQLDLEEMQRVIIGPLDVEDLGEAGVRFVVLCQLLIRTLDEVRKEYDFSE